MNTPETAGGESSELKEGTYAPTAGYEDVGMTLSQEPSEKRFAILIGDTGFYEGNNRRRERKGKGCNGG